MKVLLDTCIIIDTLQNRIPFSHASNEIFMMAAENKCEFYISAKSITDIYYLTHKITHSKEATKNIIRKILMLFNILDTTADDCKNAIYSETNDYEDAVMIESALRESFDCIVTRNIDDYKNDSIIIYKPDDFVNLINNK